MPPNMKPKGHLFLVVGVALTAIGWPVLRDSQAWLQKDGDHSKFRNPSPTDEIFHDRKSSSVAREKANEQTLLKRRIDSQLAQNPVTVEGLKNPAISYYALSNQQVAKVNQAVSDIRLEVANTVIGGMVDLEDPKDAARAVIFRGSPELAQQLKTKLYGKLEQIAGAEFAAIAVKSLQNDARFLGAGGRDVYIYVNPGDSKDSSTLERVRLEIMTEDKSQSSKWEGPPENLKRGYLLEIEL